VPKNLTYNAEKIILDAFKGELRKREGRTINDWIIKERTAVHKASIKVAKAYGLNVPSLDDIKKAEEHAIGYKDYARKLAQAVIEEMLKKSWVFYNG